MAPLKPPRAPRTTVATRDQRPSGLVPHEGPPTSRRDCRSSRRPCAQQSPAGMRRAAARRSSGHWRC
eukprot:4581293-Prymnesium_polylepis.3